MTQRRDDPGGFLDGGVVVGKMPDHDAVARVSLQLEKGGQYILRASGTDRFGNPISAGRVITISDEDDETKLRIITDTSQFKVGQEPSVIVHSRLQPHLALITIEGEGIIDHRVIQLKTGRNDISLEVGNNYFPNFTLAAAVIDGNKFYTTNHSFSVDRELKVTIEPSKTEIEPGEEIEVEITATDQNGDPVEAELSLSMVDTALLARYPDRAANTRDFFHSRSRRGAMRTASSCTFEHSPETNWIDVALLEEADRVARVETEAALRQVIISEGRRSINELALFDRNEYGDIFEDEPAAEPAEGMLLARMAQGFAGRGRGGRGGFASMAAPAPREFFPETGYWNPSIVTGRDGKAKLKLAAPDNTTTWRLTARGVTKQTLAGQGSNEVVSKKDFFVELKVPGAFTEGDEPSVNVIVHNYAQDDATIKLAVGSILGEKRLQEVRELKMGKKGTVEALFEMRPIAGVDEVTIEVSAELGDHRDSIVRTVPVQPWGIEFADAAGGTASDSTKVSLQLPADNAPYSHARLDILLGPSVNRTLVDIALGTGPILLERPGSGFIVLAGKVPEDEGWNVGEGIAVSPSREQLIEALVQDEPFMLCLGYAGWGAGQLDDEIRSGSWIITEVDLDVVLAASMAERVDAALAKLGLDATNVWMQPVDE